MSINEKIIKHSAIAVITAAGFVLASCVQQEGSKAGVEELAAKVASLESIVTDLEERKKINEVYIHYGRGIDRLDEKLYRSAFWPDAQINYGTLESITPDDHWANHMLGWHKGNLMSWGHLLTNEAIDIQGDVAHVEIYLTPMWLPKKKGEMGILQAGRYIDKLERRDGEWRIAVREYIPHFAMKIEPTQDIVTKLFFPTPPADCVLGPNGARDASYVRPLTRRTKEVGTPCAK